MLPGLREFIRPISVALLVVALLLGGIVSGALEAFIPGAGIKFTAGVAGWFNAIPEAYYNLTAVGLLGYTAGRTVEKVARVRTHAVDDPDGEAV